jgi:hypothetical protein
MFSVGIRPWFVAVRLLPMRASGRVSSREALLGGMIPHDGVGHKKGVCGVCVLAVWVAAAARALFVALLAIRGPTTFDACDM